VSTPLISVVVPVHDTRPEHLVECLDSIVSQDSGSWELVVVDDASTDPRCAETLDRYAAGHANVTVIRRTVNGGIVAASNDGLAAASGDFVALVDHDDILKPGALAAVADELCRHDDIDYLYTDEEYLHADGLITVFRKPDWSPERFRSQMYTCHLSVIRASLMRDLGGFRDGFEGSQDYDLVLRVTERARRIVHLPRVLYVWRLHGASFSRGEGTSERAYAAGVRAVQEHCDRVGIDAVVEATDVLGVHRVRRRIVGDPLVSVVIPTRGTAAHLDGQYKVLVENCISSIVERSTWTNFEFVVVADSDTPPAVLERLGRCGAGRLKVLEYDRPFNFADKCNLGVVASEGDFIVLLNDDTEIIDVDWCEAMLGLAREPEVGAVGCMLYVNDLRVQHAGLVFVDRAPINWGIGMAFGDGGCGHALACQRETVGVTGAAVMVRRDVYMEVGGMSTEFPNNFNDVDFSLKVRHTGRSVVVTPFARMFHFESLTRDTTVEPEELDLLRCRWWCELSSDPYQTDLPRPDVGVSASGPGDRAPRTAEKSTELPPA
jgi:glycosyltransferase involved in cell wall biosynthesis